MIDFCWCGRSCVPWKSKLPGLFSYRFSRPRITSFGWGWAPEMSFGRVWALDMLRRWMLLGFSVTPCCNDSTILIGMCFQLSELRGVSGFCARFTRANMTPNLCIHHARARTEVVIRAVRCLWMDRLDQGLYWSRKEKGHMFFEFQKISIALWKKVVSTYGVR